jgi:metallo-beta-lactamase family protein
MPTRPRLCRSLRSSALSRIPVVALVLVTAVPVQSQVVSVRYLGLGSQRAVSGSLHVLESGGRFVVIDAGVFMGGDGENYPWPPQVPPTRIDGVLITHAHADHIGRLPLLFREGYAGPVFMTEPTFQIALLSLAASVSLTDFGDERFYYSVHNEGRERIPVWIEGLEPPGARVVQRSNRRYITTRRPELSDSGFYLPREQVGHLAQEVQRHLRRAVTIVRPERPFTVGSFSVTPIPTSHMPGAVMYRIEKDGRVIVFSGDVGANNSPLLPANAPWRGPVDFLFVEGTYPRDGPSDPGAAQRAFRDEIGRAVRSGRRVIIPAFVVDRTQQVLFQLALGVAEGSIPSATVVCANSRSAADVTRLYETFSTSYRAGSLQNYFSPLISGASFRPAAYREDCPIRELQHGQIAIVSSGMADHSTAREAVRLFLSDPRTVFYFVGYQGEGTLGRQVRERRTNSIRIDGDNIQFRADSRTVAGFSGHARPAEIARIFRNARPGRVYLVHLEEGSIPVLINYYRSRWGSVVDAPEAGEWITLW